MDMQKNKTFVMNHTEKLQKREWKTIKGYWAKTKGNKVKSIVKVKKIDDKAKSDSTPFIQASDFTLVQRALGRFILFTFLLHSVRVIRQGPGSNLGERERCPRGVSFIHSFINHLSMCRPWPISQLRPPDTQGLIKKARDNGITG